MFDGMGGGWGMGFGGPFMIVFWILVILGVVVLIKWLADQSSAGKGSRLDPNERWLAFARAHGAGTERYCVGRAGDLPFAERSFDRAISVTALCFVENARRALDQVLRVTRKRFAIGLLNRHSLVYVQKGRHGGSGAYRGAHWHTRDEILALLGGLPAANVTLETAVLLPGGGPVAGRVECLASGVLPLGAFIVAAGDVLRAKDHG